MVRVQMISATSHQKGLANSGEVSREKLKRTKRDGSRLNGQLRTPLKILVRRLTETGGQGALPIQHLAFALQHVGVTMRTSREESIAHFSDDGGELDLEQGKGCEGKRVSLPVSLKAREAERYVLTGVFSCRGRGMMGRGSKGS